MKAQLMWSRQCQVGPSHVCMHGMRALTYQDLLWGWAALLGMHPFPPFGSRLWQRLQVTLQLEFCSIGTWRDAWRPPLAGFTAPTQALGWIHKQLLLTSSFWSESSNFYTLLQIFCMELGEIHDRQGKTTQTFSVLWLQVKDVQILHFS